MRVRDRRRELDLTNEPKPYEYGLVGHTSSGILTSTPPSTPPASTSLNHHSRSSTFLHSRADSTTPLMYPIGPGPSSPPPDILMQGSDYGHRQRRSSGADIWNTRPASIHTTSGNNVQRLSRNSASRLSLTMPADHLGPIGDGILGGGSSRSLAVLLPSSPEGRELQVVNAPLSPSSVHSPPPGLQRTSPRAGPSSLPSGGSSTPPPGRQDKSLRRARRASSSSSVIVHTDAGRVLDDRVSLSGSILGASGPVLSTVVDDPPPPAYAA
ncbi:hypothetical protein BV25DRAFT_677813 [Artomyces pyxidatus]|uniref:Uncharacterized protein n=1 Tax=Artomyces pyxidatus TaxID=48021 RepID=A0ACB8T0V3_9AGAM|nr:hypothetical protein BV25DRAFT_677813 [Artomyces pyxidatus]